MALLEDLLKSPNLWIGVGVALATRMALPVLGVVVRPLAKATIKGYLATAEALTPVMADAVGQAREWLAEPLAPAQERIEAATPAHAMAAAPAIPPRRAEEIRTSSSSIAGTETEPTPAEAAPAATGETPALAKPKAAEAAPVSRRPRKRRVRPD